MYRNDNMYDDFKRPWGWGGGYPFYGVSIQLYSCSKKM